ncbi:hypothetical protein Mycsm_01436 [Mycobacterium sp. JS623]|uniref:hypothetical protein n=1 Tax=Mycobacterium sp. JS623 TaxID=212767 RepID=UPI0002A55CFB|nr:hypothetical protein [Mycobacterium sp. JS623]AGB21847.1 hypothetical protein Mycsm_01436 [Mycobacterium sp. JS623]
MNRPYTAHSPYSLTPTERIRGDREDGGVTVDLDRERYDEYDGVEEYDDEYGDIEEYYEPIDRRWIWVAGVAGAILLVAVICTVVILGGGDSGSVSTTVAPPATTTQPAATSAPRATTSAAPPAATLPPETVTTVSPSASAAPTETPAVAAPAPAAAPNTITYRVTGNRNLLDLVTVIYTDSQGALQTDVNVALPWVKTVVLDPGVTLSSVTATSVTGQLNCSITDASGTALAVQNNNTMIANCTK